MQDLITVKPHPENENGWAIFEGEKMIDLLNDNFFTDKNHAESVAKARRHVIMQRMLRKMTGVRFLPSLK